VGLISVVRHGGCPRCNICKMDDTPGQKNESAVPKPRLEIGCPTRSRWGGRLLWPRVFRLLRTSAIPRHLRPQDAGLVTATAQEHSVFGPAVDLQCAKRIGRLVVVISMVAFSATLSLYGSRVRCGPPTAPPRGPPLPPPDKAYPTVNLQSVLDKSRGDVTKKAGPSGTQWSLQRRYEGGARVTTFRAKRQFSALKKCKYSLI
jgi:hypothetical protein